MRVIKFEEDGECHNGVVYQVTLHINKKNILHGDLNLYVSSLS